MYNMLIILIAPLYRPIIIHACHPQTAATYYLFIIPFLLAGIKHVSFMACVCGWAVHSLANVAGSVSPLPLLWRKDDGGGWNWAHGRGLVCVCVCVTCEIRHGSHKWSDKSLPSSSSAPPSSPSIHPRYYMEDCYSPRTPLPSPMSSCGVVLLIVL